MIRRVLLCTLASVAMTSVAAAAPGGRGGGGGGEGRGGLMAGGGLGGGTDASSRGMGGLGGIGDASTRGGMNGRMDGNVGVANNQASRINSQGASHASQTAIEHANQNSVLAGTSATRTVTSGALSGLTTGATLYSNGSAVGTVQQIRTTGKGSVALIIVKGTNGSLYAVPASKLSLNGGTLSTTARLNGINASPSLAANGHARMNSQGPVHASATGIAHANSHSVLAGTSGIRTASVQSGRGRLNSEGPAHASASGIAHADFRSVLAAGKATSALTGVSVGMPLFSNGAKVGTVTRVVTANGIVTRVLVQGLNGRTYSLAPRQLTVASGSLSTSTTLHGL